MVELFLSCLCRDPDDNNYRSPILPYTYPYFIYNLSDKGGRGMKNKIIDYGHRLWTRSESCCHRGLFKGSSGVKGGGDIYNSAKTMMRMKMMNE